MPFTVERDDAHRCLIARAAGALSAADFLEFLERFRTGDDRTYGVLADLRDASAMPNGPELHQFAQLVATLTRAAPRGRVALLATNVDIYDAARQLEERCEADGVLTVRACRTLEEANAWLSGASRPS